MTTVCWGCDDLCVIFFLLLGIIPFFALLLQENITALAPEADAERTHIKVRTKRAKSCEKDGNYDEAIHIWSTLGKDSDVARAKKKQKEWEEAELRKERKEKVGKAKDLEELFNKEKEEDGTEPDKHLDEAIEIWKNLGDKSEIERLNKLKMNYLYEELKKKIYELKNKGVDCTLLEKELSMLEKSLDKTPE